MVEKKFKCPDCGKVASYSGMPGELKTIYCPYCGSKGRVRLPELKHRDDLAIEVARGGKWLNTFKTPPLV